MDGFSPLPLPDFGEGERAGRGGEDGQAPATEELRRYGIDKFRGGGEGRERGSSEPHPLPTLPRLLFNMNLVLGKSN